MSVSRVAREVAVVSLGPAMINHELGFEPAYRFDEVVRCSVMITATFAPSPLHRRHWRKYCDGRTGEVKSRVCLSLVEAGRWPARTIRDQATLLHLISNTPSKFFYDVVQPSTTISSICHDHSIGARMIELRWPCRDNLIRQDVEAVAAMISCFQSRPFASSVRLVS